MLYFLLDAGGTFFKCALYDASRDELLPVWQTPVDSAGTAEEIAAAWQSAGAQAAQRAQGEAVAAVCVSTPGPFDYEAGVSRMTHKFAAARGLPIRPWLRASLGEVPVHFLHDATAFLLGACPEGARSPAGVMLGTGFGFACMRDGRVLVNPQRGPAVSLWNRPFRGGIVEDTISRRALRQSYRRLGGDDADVREIALRARAGEEAARRVFTGLSEALCELLPPVLTELGSDSLVLGGQISLSADLFLPALQAALPLPVTCCERPDAAALLGAARFAACGGAMALETVLS